MKKLRIMNIYSFFILCLIASFAMNAQETAPNYLMYYYNMNTLNPAYAGVSDKAEIAVGFRNQTMDIQDNLRAQYASFSKAVGNNLGLGLSVVNDEVFISRQTDVVIDASYKLQLDRTTNLYFGMKAGGAFYAIDFNSLGVTDPLFTNNESTISPLIGFGAFLKGERYYVNISSPNLLLSEIQKPKLDNRGGIISDGVEEKFHMYLGGGYRFSVSESIDVTQSVFSRFVADEDILLDISATANFSNKVETGLTYRLNTSVIFSIFLKLMKSTHFGYAYESNISDYSAISSGSHEFVVKFNW